MAKRKSISVKWLIEHVNEFNRSSADIYKNEREGKNMMLEIILHETGNYCGFNYLHKDQLTGDAMSVGIREQYADGTWNFNNTDSTRVFYYIDDKL